MSNEKGNALVILSLIIGAIGVGMGVSSILIFQVVEGPQGDPGVDGVDGVDGVGGINATLNNVVGIWENIEGGPSIGYYLNFSDIRVNESEFFTLTNGNTNLTLIQAGWYRISIRFRWIDLSSIHTYDFYIEKNGVGEHLLEYVFHPSSSAYFVKSFAYIYSDGDDFFTFACVNLDISDSFSVTSDHSFNQFVLEYVKES